MHIHSRFGVCGNFRQAVLEAQIAKIGRENGYAQQIRALPTETKVESGTSQSKSGTSLDFSNSGFRRPMAHNNEELEKTICAHCHTADY